ncbi:uncharacterized protein G2W53_026794 [Senna tora]|uniref:Uncharacterized protein n=1 Tax=Senna tora TaxID=362788 RepID=A0A834TPQ4_9FABA|nr:uncharacterized protein G2W53_026794 [Senna tora]
MAIIHIIFILNFGIFSSHSELETSSDNPGSSDTEMG